MTRWLPAVTLVVFGMLYILISIVNHRLYRTFGLDLGYYTQALYQYAHLQMPNNGMISDEGMDQVILSGHFDLYLLLLSPLVYIFGSYTLLIVQIVALLFGGWGVYRLMTTYTQNNLIPWCVMVCFMGCFGVWQALGYDYHSNVVAACLLPWFLLALRQRKFLGATLLLVLMSVAKESTALWLVFVVLALFFDIDFRKDRQARRWHFVYLGYSVLSFVLISMVIMPAFGEVGSGFDRYSHMGNSMSEVALYVLTHPGEAVTMLFSDFGPENTNSPIKMDFYFCALCSCGLLAFFKPNYLIMVAPPLVLKMFARTSLFWGVGYHYNIEICTVLVIAAGIAVARYHERWVGSTVWRYVTIGLAALMVVTTLYTTRYTVFKSKGYVFWMNMNVFQDRHYRQTDFDCHQAKELLQMIPKDASVCASTNFVPHLALRDSVSIFPFGLDRQPEYILLVTKPLEYMGMDTLKVKEVLADTARYATLAQGQDLVLLRYR